MTKNEFMGQFDRLCRGLDYEATAEQAEAIFRRIGHIGFSVWAESVTTLLCDGRKGFLPKLEHLLDVLDREAESQRKAAIWRDRPVAESVLQKLSRETSEQENGRIPRPGTPLLACIKAFSGRAQAYAIMEQIPQAEKWGEEQKQREMHRLHAAIAEYDQEIAQYSPLIHDADAARLVQKYESVSAA